MSKVKQLVVFLLLILVSTGMMVAQGQSEGAAEPITELQVSGPWSATEADAFEIVLEGFTESTGIDVVYEAVGSEVVKVLGTRIAAGETPDMAILPVANGLKDLTAQGALVPLNDLRDMMEENFDTGWIDQYTIDGNIMAIPTRANVSNLLWFNPQVVTDVPATWEEFVAYADNNAANGQATVAGLAKTSWTLTILFEDAYLSTFGADRWNALMTGDLPWNDKTVIEAVARIAAFYGDDYAAGGREGALGTGLVDGIARVFGTDSDAQFVAAGSWVAGIVKGAINEAIVEGETIDYVPFIGDAAGDGCIIAAADVAVILNDSPEVRQLLNYLASAEGQSLFAPNGYTVANKNIDLAIFNGLAQKSSRMLANSKVAPSTGVMMSNESRNVLIEVLQAAILDPENIPALLDELEMNIGTN